LRNHCFGPKVLDKRLRLANRRSCVRIPPGLGIFTFKHCGF
jgi:hypothetical protein